MNWAGSIFFWRTGVLFLAWLWVAATAWAGEPIVFASKRSPLPAVTTEDLEAKVVKSLPKFSSPTPFDGLGIAPMPDSSRPQEGRRDNRGKKNDSQAQKWNWDELQDEEPDDPAWDSWRFEIEEDTSSTTGVGSRFREISSTSAVERDQDRREARIPTHLMGTRQRQKLEERAARGRQDDEALAAEAEAPSKSGPASHSTGEGGFDVKGARAEESEASTLSLLAPGDRPSFRTPDRTDSGMRRTLGGPQDSGAEGSHESVLDGLRRGLDSSDLARLGSLFEPVNLQPDLSPKRLSPTLPETPRTSLDLRSGSDTSAGIDRGLAPLPDVMSRPSGLDLGSPARSDSFSLRPPAPEPSGPPRPFGIGGTEIPRRGGVLGR